MKYTIIISLFFIIISISGCGKWHEIDNFNATISSEGGIFSRPWKRTVIVVIEENQDGDKRAYALFSTGEKIDIDIRHAERVRVSKDSKAIR